MRSPRTDLAADLDRVFGDIDKLPKMLHSKGGQWQLRSEVYKILGELEALSRHVATETHDASRLRVEDLVAAEIIRNAKGVEDLTRKTPPDAVVETIAQLAERWVVSIKVGNGSYNASAFRRLGKQCGGLPYNTHLKVLKTPPAHWEERSVKMTPEGVKHKTAPACATGGARVLDDVAGLVSAVVAVTNTVDEVKDLIEPGAFKETLRKRWPKGVDSHQWELPVAKTLAVEELMPGDPRLPERLHELGAGGLLVLAEFNLQTQRGQDAYSNVKFFGDSQEWSIGFAVPDAASTFDPKTGVRTIHRIDLYEYSPVLFGAAPLTGTLSAASAPSARLSSAISAVSLEQSIWGYLHEQSALPNNNANRRRATALARKVIEVERDPRRVLEESMMEFALSGRAGQTRRGREAAVALVLKAIGPQRGQVPHAPYPAGAYATRPRANDEEGAPSSNPTYQNDPPGLSVGPHTYRPPAVSKPISKETPCLICSQGPLAPIHTDRNTWMTFLGGATGLAPRSA